MVLELERVSQVALDTLAQEYGRTTENCVIEAVENWIENKAFLKLALERSQDTGKTYSLDEVQTLYDLQN